MNLNLIHEYIETVYRYDNYAHEQRENRALLAVNMSIAWNKLDEEEQEEVRRLLELRGL